MYNVSRYRPLEVTSVVSRKLKQCYARYEKPLKNHPLDVAKKYVETYSSSNSAAQDPKERVRLINIQQIHYKIYSLIQKFLKGKRKSSERDD